MSKLLDDLRNEQRHYEQTTYANDRAERIKVIADHIQDLEAKLAKAVGFVTVQRDIAYRRGDSFLYNDYRRFLKEIEKGE